MFQTIKDNVIAALFAISVIVIFALVTTLTISSAELSAANANLEKEIAAKAVIQTDLDNATVQLKAAEIEKERLRLDAALTAKTLTVREQGRNTIDAELVGIKAKAKAVMESSTDEADKSWTIAAVPDELNRLLEQRSYCANRDNDQDSVCIAASAINERMQHSTVHGPNQSRSL